MPELVTVLIPFFNRALFLGATIRSVLQQRGVALQLLLVDDGSTDHSVAVVRTFADRRLRLLRLRRRSGKPAAVNRALPAARGGVDHDF